jgi:hypothetical protein
MNNAPFLRVDDHARFADTQPLLEVVEGNEDSDWAAWEDSVRIQDSQFSELQAETQSVQKGSSLSDSRDDEVTDPFASVRRRSA